MGFFSKVIDMFTKQSTWKKGFLWFVLSQLVYFIMLFITVPEVEKLASGKKVFDLMPFGYSPDYAVRLLKTLGEQGRHIYLNHQIPLDMIYPGLMGITGGIFIALLAKKVSSRMEKFILIPIFAAGFDYLENVMVAAMLISFPKTPQIIYSIASTVTVIKSLLTVSYLGLLATLLCIFLLKLLLKNDKLDKREPI